MLIFLLWNLIVTLALAIVLLACTQLRFLQRRPSLRHTLWLLLIAKLFTPSWIQVPVLPTRPIPNEFDSVLSNTESELPDTNEQSLPLPLTVDILTNDVATPIELPVLDASVANEAPFSVPVLLLFGSIAGSITLAVIYYLRTSKLRRWIRRAASEQRQLTECCDEVATRLGFKHAISCRVVEATTTPLLSGLLRPVLIVPRGLIDSLTSEQLRGVVAHEMAHYARRDHWSNLFAFTAKLLMWWNPVTWWAHREVRAAQESCCDAIAIGIGDRRSYAIALFQTLNFVQKGPFANHELALGVEENGSILRRFEMIADTRLSHRLPRIALPMILVLSVGLVCLPVRGQQKTVALDEPVNSKGESESTNTELTEDHGEDLVLGGITKPEKIDVLIAWTIEPTGAIRRVQAGDVLAVSGRQAEILEVTPSHIVVTFDGLNTYGWKIGKRLSVIDIDSALSGPEFKAKRGASQQRWRAHVTNSNSNTSDKWKAIVATDGGGLEIRGRKEDVEEIADVINRKPNDEDNAVSVQVEVVDDRIILRGTKKDDEAGKARQMRIDSKTSNLLMFGTKQEHKTIRDILNKLQASKRPVSGDLSAASAVERSKIRFSFSSTPWKEVLNWYAKEAGLSLVADRMLPDALSYSDPRNYSVKESMDVLNGLLLTKGYSLFRRDRLLYLVFVNNGVPKEMVSPIVYDQLGDKGNYEFVSVMFPIGDREPEKVRAEIMPLLTEPGRVDLLRATRQVLVTDRKNRMQSIQLLIGSIPQPKKDTLRR